MDEYCSLCTHLNEGRKYCEKWRKRLGYTKYKGAISFTAFDKCDECKAEDDDKLLMKILIKNAKPILFSTSMVQAVLEERKTQTRRVVRRKDYDSEIHAKKYTCFDCETERKDLYKFHDNEPGHNHIKWGVGVRAKYAVGDVLYVRETWSRGYVGGEWGYVYKADGTEPYHTEKWKPSIHMPKAAARLFIRVKNVRVERLQDISLEDIENEGFYCDPEYSDPNGISRHAYPMGMRIHFSKFWDYLNAKRGYDWKSNPWVWVYEFEKVDYSHG